MKITINREKHIFIINITGEMDSSAFEVLFLINKLSENNESHIILNLENTTFIDTTGVGSLLHISKQLQKKGIPFHVVSAQGAVKNVFELIKLEKTLPYTRSLDEAMAYCNN